jgi:hypothetical protein
VALGLDPGDFWSLTPRELALRTKGASRRLRHEHNEQMAIAYIAATLVMATKRPPLKKYLLPEDPGPKRRKSWQEIKAALMLALGPGKDTADG